MGPNQVQSLVSVSTARSPEIWGVWGRKLFEVHTYECSWSNVMWVIRVTPGNSTEDSRAESETLYFANVGQGLVTLIDDVFMLVCANPRTWQSFKTSCSKNVHTLPVFLTVLPPREVKWFQQPTWRRASAPLKIIMWPATLLPGSLGYVIRTSTQWLWWWWRPDLVAIYCLPRSPYDGGRWPGDSLLKGHACTFFWDKGLHLWALVRVRGKPRTNPPDYVTSKFRYNATLLYGSNSITAEAI